MLCGKELKEGDGYTLEKEKLCLGEIRWLTVSEQARDLCRDIRLCFG